MARIQEEIHLPSAGKLYKSDLTLQNMTVAEEKCLYGSSAESAVHKILKKCIVEDDVSVDDMIVPDVHYALVKLRQLSYGDDYPVDVTCPHCEHKFSHTVMLSDLECDYLGDDFQEPWEITLPISKDTLQCKIPRSKDLKRFDELAKKKATKFKQNEREVDYVYKLMLGIVSVNGESMLPDELYTYISSLPARDGAYIKHAFSKIKVGYDTTITAECPACNSSTDFQLPMTADFFLAEFDD